MRTLNFFITTTLHCDYKYVTECKSATMLINIFQVKYGLTLQYYFLTNEIILLVEKKDIRVTQRYDKPIIIRKDSKLEFPLDFIHHSSESSNEVQGPFCRYS